MTKAEWSGWMQAVFSVAAIAAAFFIARWQSNKERRLLREREIAAAEVAAITVGYLGEQMVSALVQLRTDIADPITRNAFDLLGHSQRFAELVFPTESQSLALAHVMNDGAVLFTRASIATKKLERGLGWINRTMADMEAPEWNQTLLNLLPMIEQALQDLHAANKAFKKFLESRAT